MEIVPLIISLVTGALGGNAAGALLKEKSLGVLGNSLSGILGGGLGGSLLQLLGIAAAPSGSLDLTSILGSVASGGVGGGVVMAIISFIKSALVKK
jgi:uncharacterized membrane protein YeaQ/YmgE (transglycosylase-associated protein family)